MGCFGNSGAASQREADHLALINRCKTENTSLKADLARLEREMAELRSQSAETVRQKEEEAAMVRREMTALRSQLGQATDKEGEVAEHTVSLIQEIADLKGRLRAAGGAGVDVGSGGGAADSITEVSRLRGELEEAKEEARSYSEEIGDLARQISDFQSKHVETESYRKEIKYLRSKLGSSDAGSPDSMSCSSAEGGGGGGGGGSSGDGASDLFGFMGDLLGSSSSYGGGSSMSASSSLNSSPIKSARGTFSFDSKNVIQTVSLTSGFFGGKSRSIASDASVTLGDGSSKRSTGSIRSSSAHTSKASVVTPREGDLPANIDAEVVSNAIKCVEDLIKRVNQSRSKGSSLSAGATGRRPRSFEEDVEVFDLPASMRGTFDDVAADCSTSTATGVSRQVPTDDESSEQNSSFYSAASTKEGAASSPTKKKASSTRSPRFSTTSSGSAIIDTSSWRPVGTTGDLLAGSEDSSTIGTLEVGDEYGLDDSESLYSAYSAPLLTGSTRKGSRNESAVIIADLYRVQNLLSSVLEGRPHVKEQLQSSLLQPHSR